MAFKREASRDATAGAPHTHTHAWSPRSSHEAPSHDEDTRDISCTRDETVVPQTYAQPDDAHRTSPRQTQISHESRTPTCPHVASGDLRCALISAWCLPKADHPMRHLLNSLSRATAVSAAALLPLFLLLPLLPLVHAEHVSTEPGGTPGGTTTLTSSPPGTATKSVSPGAASKGNTTSKMVDISALRLQPLPESPWAAREARAAASSSSSSPS